MAVVWTAEGVGQATKDWLVRDPVVVQASLPRFLAPATRPASASTSPTPPAPPARSRSRLAASDPALLPAEARSFAGTLGDAGRLIFDAAPRRHGAPATTP